MNVPANASAPGCPPHASALRSADFQSAVSRISNPQGVGFLQALGTGPGTSRLEAGDTAGWKPALRDQILLTSAATGERAFTRLELLVVMGALALLAVVATPLLGNTVFRSQRVVCANNLRQISVGFRAYAMNNQGKYPWIVNTNITLTTSILAAQAELGTTRILTCPSDYQRSMILSFSNFNSVAVSYFLNSMAQEHQSISLLSGDRNFSGNGNLTDGNVSWTDGNNHNTEGNIVLVDGQVKQFSVSALQKSVSAALSKNYAIFIQKP